MSKYYDNAPSRYEIQCENGDIDEDTCHYETVVCLGYYMIENYKYPHDFPKEWAQNHMEGTGPEQCNNCYWYGSIDGVFMGYCLNCAHIYNGERGPGLALDFESEEDSSTVDPNEDQVHESETESDRMAKEGEDECQDESLERFRLPCAGCSAATVGLPNQQAHYEPGGCLYCAEVESEDECQDESLEVFCLPVNLELAFDASVKPDSSSNFSEFDSSSVGV